MITALISVLFLTCVCPLSPGLAHEIPVPQTSQQAAKEQSKPFWSNKCLVKANIVRGLGVDFWFTQIADKDDPDLHKVNVLIRDWVATMAAQESFECERLSQSRELRFAYDLQRPLRMPNMRKAFFPAVTEAGETEEYVDDDKAWPPEVMKTLYGQVWGSAEQTFLTADLISIEAVNQGYLFGGKGDHSSTGSFMARLRPAQKLELEDIFCKDTGYVQFLSNYCRKELLDTSVGKYEPQWVKNVTSANVNNFRTVILTGPSQHPDTHEQYEGRMIFEFDGYPIWKDKDGTPTLTRHLSVGIEFSKLQPYLNPEIYALLKKAKLGG
jgi:hypothetical protein